MIWKFPGKIFVPELIDDGTQSPLTRAGMAATFRTKIAGDTKTSKAQNIAHILCKDVNRN